jgi:hypothetical protein
MSGLIKQEVIEERIFVIRGQRIMIDRDLADLYGVETKNLNRQVKRNIDRFPEEFMFQLTKEEKDELVTNWHRFKSLKHSASLPYAFTEHGVTMMASVLSSPQAIKMSILIIKVFVRLRNIIESHKEILSALKELEKRVAGHDKSIHSIVEAIRQLMATPEKPKYKIGFKRD